MSRFGIPIVLVDTFSKGIAGQCLASFKRLYGLPRVKVGSTVYLKNKQLN